MAGRVSRYELVTGDCLEAMREMRAESVDACVTDPPYGLRFMGKRWDYDVPSVEVFREMHRVLKDGGRLLCFAGARTMHRMWVNIEDAGFTIEDSIAWLYGSGFPKHRSKLKPAYEPICVARKGSVSELNIDAARIGTETITTHGGGRASTENHRLTKYIGTEHTGRWPANVALDERAAELLDEQSGELTSCGTYWRRGMPINKVYGAESRPDGAIMQGFGDSGGASRFFYCAKADRSEREYGLEGVPERKLGDKLAGGMVADRERGVRFNNPVANHHPTVKPVDLMRWLVRLAAKPGETVLDPFCGSGTTGVACTLEGVHFIGIEREAEYVEIARRRIVNAQPSLFASGGA